MGRSHWLGLCTILHAVRPSYCSLQTHSCQGDIGWGEEDGVWNAQVQECELPHPIDTAVACRFCLLCCSSAYLHQTQRWTRTVDRPWNHMCASCHLGGVEHWNSACHEGGERIGVLTSSVRVGVLVHVSCKSARAEWLPPVLLSKPRMSVSKWLQLEGLCRSVQFIQEGLCLLHHWPTQAALGLYAVPRGWANTSHSFSLAWVSHFSMHGAERGCWIVLSKQSQVVVSS